MKQLLLIFSILGFFAGTVLAQPVISTTIPSENQRNISTDANITINFSEAMDDATITTLTVRVFGSSRGLYSGSFTYGATSATFNPDLSFIAGEIISVVITTGVENSSNVAMTSSYSFNFTVDAEGNGKFQAPVSYTVKGSSNYAHQSVAADIDEDGDLDLITTTPLQNTITVFKNDGDGTFAAGIDYSTPSSSFEIAAADIDNDGDVDLMTANLGANSLSVFTNNGSGAGTFSARVDYSTPNQKPVRNHVAVDMNGDGFVDIVQTDIDNDSLYTFLNMGTGTFGASTGYTTAGLSPLSFADLDEDGDMDIIGVDAVNDQFTVFDNDGAGNLSAGSSYIVGDSPVAIAFADLNSSVNKLDAITANGADNNITVFEDGSGVLLFSSTTFSVGEQPTWVTTADLDGDGDLDAIVSNAVDQNLSILTNDGSASFSETTLPLPSTYGNHVLAADVDGDGDMDIITSNQDGTFSVLKNYAGGHVTSVSPINGGLHNSASGNIDIVFDENIDQATLTSSTVEVTGSLSGAINGSFLYNSGTNTATFDPTDDFVAGEVVTITVNTGVESALGVPLESGYTSGFVVAAGDGGVFGASAEYTAGNEPRAVVMADFNADGNADIATANTSADSIAVIISNGDGTFASPVNYYAGDAPTAVTAGDVNGDGDIDLVSVANESSFSVFVGDGYGTFAARSTKSTGAVASEISLADIDNDGDLDAVYLAGSQARKQFNDGSGNFNDEWGFSTGTTNISPVDIDNDGDLDFVYANSSNLVVTINNGTNSYSGATYALGSSPGGVVTGDFNGDGYIDAVATSSGNISYYQNNGNGTFAGKADFSITDSGIPQDVISTDIDGDGDLDVLLAHTDNDEMVAFINDGTGDFTEDGQYSTGENPYALASADINRDGVMDVVTANSNADNISVLFGGEAVEITSVSPAQNGLEVVAGSDIAVVFSSGIDSDTFNSTNVLISGSVTGIHSGTYSYNGGTNTAIVNPDNDFAAGEVVTVLIKTGIQNEIGASIPSAYQWSFAIGASAEESFGGKIVYDFTGELTLNGLASADMDGDGDADMIALTAYDDAVAVLFNDGSGTFENIDTTHVTTSSSYALAVADLDNDGDADVAVTTENSGNTVFIFMNDGTGNLGAGVSYAVTDGYLSDIEAGDINGDGYQDLVIAKYDSGQIEVLLNDGDGTFTPQTAVTTGSGPWGVTLIDVDEDGDLDMVTSDYDDATVSVHKNYGNGTFEAKTSYSTGGYFPYFIASADLDGDGDIDVVTMNEDDSNISVMLNQGAGNFSSNTQYDFYTTYIVFKDIDADGDLDLIGAGGDHLYISKNDGAGDFGTPISYQGGSTVSTLAAADIDSDGDTDIFVGNYYENTVSVLKNIPLIALTSSSPSANANDVAASSNITATFTVSMDGVTMVDTTVIVRGSKTGLVSGNISYDDPSKTLTFDPTNDFLPGEVISLTLTDAIESSDGYGLQSTYITTFTIAASGNGNMAYRDSVALSASVWRLASADIDNDGDEDLIGSTNSIIDVYENDGGTFSFLAQSAMPSGFEAVYPADIDNDGDVDLAVHAFSSPNEIRFLENDGSGNFAVAETLAVSGSPNDANFQDFDGDGNIDVAYIYGAQAAIIQWGEDGFSFSSSSSSFGGGPGYPTPLSLTSGDVDNDGDIDIVLIGDGKVVIGINNGGRSFDDESTYEVGTDPADVELADFDGDGYLDIVVASEEGASFSVLTNDGDGTFGEAEEYSISPYWATRVSPFDYDGDGDIDLAIYAYDDNAATEHMLFAYNSSGSFANQLLFQYPEEDPYFYNGANENYRLIDIDGDNDLDLASLVGNSAIAFAENVAGSSSTPATAASNISIDHTSYNSATISWTKGDGSRSLVLIKEASAVDADPVDNSGYAPNPAFGSGAELGTGNYVVYAGSGSSAAISGLSSETTYHVEVFELNGIPGQEKFLVAGAPTSSFTTTEAPAIWNTAGGTVTFTKADGADWTLEENQDQIAWNVWLTRKNSGGLFNIYSESSFDNNSPAGTQWAVGTTAEIGSLTFQSFNNALDGAIGDNIENTDMVLFLTEHDIYVDIKFSSWSCCGDGGYSYTRGDGIKPTPPPPPAFDSTAGYALSFDGTDDYMYFDLGGDEESSTPMSDPVTFEMWVNPTELPVSGKMVLAVSQGSQYEIGIDSTYNFYATFRDTDNLQWKRATGTTVVSENEWYHLAVSAVSDGNIKLYVNGVAEDSVSITGLNTSIDRYRFGAKFSFSGPEHTYNGLMDEVRIWKVERTESEIRANMFNTNSGGDYANMFATWQMNEGSGASVVDLVNGNDLDLDQDGASYQPAWVTSDAPAGGGTSTLSSSFQSGTVSVGNASLNTADDFDNPVDVQVTEISSDPNSFPSGFSAGLGGKYFVINLFGTPGTFNVTLTLTFGEGVVTDTQEANPGSLKLYKRSSTSSGSWTEIGGATTATALTGEVTWEGLTSFSQFMAVAEEYVPPVFDIQISNGSDVIAYNDSTFTFESDFFNLSGDFADSNLTINSKSTLSGDLYLDQNSNGTYDDGTDNLLIADAEFSYTPSGSVKLRYASDVEGFESATLQFQFGGNADTVSIEFFTIEGSPELSGISGEGGWYLLANPMDTTLGFMLEDIWTQGAINSNAPHGDATLYTYSQDSSEYVAITTDIDTTKLTAGTGLLAYIYAFDDYNEGVPEGGGWPKTLNNFGNPFGTDINIPVKNVDHDGVNGTTGSEGFVLLGNPYGWSISSDSVIATLKREDPLANSYVYRWKPVEKVYQLASSGPINAYESFFVRVVTSGESGTLSFDYEDAHIENSEKHAGEDLFELILVHSKSGLESSSFIRFDEDANQAIDPYDGYYLGSYASKFANLYTLTGDQRLTINNLPYGWEGELEFPVYLDATVTGDFNMKWNNEALPEGVNITLKYYNSGEEISLNTENSFSFTLDESILAKTAGESPKPIPLNKKGGRTNKQSTKPMFLVTLISNLGTSAENNLGIPTEVELHQNYPNPFNPTSVIRFGVPEVSKVKLEVFDILGRNVMTLVNNETKSPGRYNVQFDARKLSSGMYIYRLVVGDKVMTKKMTLIK